MTTLDPKSLEVAIANACLATYLDGRKGSGGVVRNYNGTKLWFSYESDSLKYGRYLTMSLSGECWSQIFEMWPDERLLVEENRWNRQDHHPAHMYGQWIVRSGHYASPTMGSIQTAREFPVFAPAAGRATHDWGIDFAAMWLLTLASKEATISDDPNTSYKKRPAMTMVCSPLQGSAEAMMKDLTLVRMFSE